MFEKRVAKLRRIVLGLLAVTVTSLAASCFLQPVPLLFMLTTFGCGIVWGIVMILSKTINPFWQGIISGAMMPVFFILADAVLPSGQGSLSAVFWPGISAAAVGLTGTVLVLFRTFMRRTLPAALAEQAAAKVFEKAGDSHFKALLRVSATKTGKVYLLLMIFLASMMGAFGVFGWFEGVWIGLLLTAFMVPAIAIFTWMLILRDGAERMRRTIDVP
ncbi:MAG: hypothetical protein IH600_07475 [Bacteroidetes bacterium]|nr:hypothetical protein [Bacteroidota bacterium]